MVRQPRTQQEQKATAIPMSEETIRGGVAVRVQSCSHPAGTRTTVEAA